MFYTTICATALKSLYIEMDIDGDKLDVILLEENHGRGVGGDNVDDDDYNASN